MSQPTASNPSLPEKLKKEAVWEKIAYERSYRLAEGQLAVLVARDQEHCIITLLSDIQGPLVLHWGASYNSSGDWVLPPSSMYPAGTAVFQNTAAQTPFVDNDGIRRLILEIDEKEAPAGLLFVLRQSDTGRWIKEQGQNFFIPVAV